MPANTIVLKGMGNHDEGRLDEIVSPGHAIELAADGDYDLVQSAQATAARRGIKIVKEDGLQGKTVDDAYAVDDVVFFYTPQSGDHIQVLVKSAEDIDIGDYLVVEGAGSGLFVEVGTAGSYELELALSTGKVHDAMATDLPAAAANDDIGIITGTPGTDAVTLQGVDFGGTATDEKGSFEVVLPADYKAASTLTLRVRAAILTTIADASLTIDANVWETDEDGAVGSDLVTTAAGDCNSLTIADFDFVVTPTALLPGDKIIIRLSFAGSDAGNLGVMIPEVSKVSLLYGTTTDAQLESLEDSGGALGANTLMACRVL